MTTIEAPSRHRAKVHVPAGDGPVRWLLRVLAWMLILACTAVLAAAVLVPRLAGATPYTILTGSMAPGMPPGTLVVVKPVDTTTIPVGAVVTYQLESGKPTVVTHRVVATRTTVLGEREYQTQGDANDVADEKWVRPEQIRGQRWYSVRGLGRLNTVLSGHSRQLLVYGAAGALVVYAGAMFAGAGRQRLRGRSA
ncbi:signal peptidase I [Nocardioides rubriscoriae]|uniref:signal peptidase I n=1 Tax=Nocardioides rubriscoriae TaxID=642762 RepID=UPI0011DFF363|nr:signal peptidase I [Nocardioides rubriscoriae]